MHMTLATDASRSSFLFGKRRYSAPLSLGDVLAHSLSLNACGNVIGSYTLVVEFR